MHKSCIHNTQSAKTCQPQITNYRVFCTGSVEGEAIASTVGNFSSKNHRIEQESEINLITGVSSGPVNCPPWTD